MSSFDRMLGWFPHTRGGCDMLKSVLFRLWLMGFAALIAVLTPGAAVAEPIIVIISSQHNLECARRACSSVANPEGIAECKFVGDGRHLGRKLENEVRSGMATRACTHKSTSHV